MKKGFLFGVCFVLAVSSICLAVVPDIAEAAQTENAYEVTGKIVADDPLFLGEKTVDIVDGYYSHDMEYGWVSFSCDSADGNLSIHYYLEKDRVYRLVVIDHDKPEADPARIVTYVVDGCGIIGQESALQGETFYADEYKIDFSNLTFTKVGERIASGIYEAEGFNTLNADYVQVKVWGGGILISFFKNDQRIELLLANANINNAEGTVTYKYTYQYNFKASVTNTGRVYGFVSGQGEDLIEFDMQLKESLTIKDGRYSAKGNFVAGVDEIRFSAIDTSYSMELMNEGNAIRSYELYLDEAKQDGTLILEAFGGSNTVIYVYPDGNVTGQLNGEYDLSFETSLTRID